jgi:hypothetical protein
LESLGFEADGLPLEPFEAATRGFLL